MRFRKGPVEYGRCRHSVVEADPPLVVGDLVLVEADHPFQDPCVAFCEIGGNLRLGRERCELDVERPLPETSDEPSSNDSCVDGPRETTERSVGQGVRWGAAHAGASVDKEFEPRPSARGGGGSNNEGALGCKDASQVECSVLVSPELVVAPGVWGYKNRTCPALSTSTGDEILGGMRGRRSTCSCPAVPGK